MEGVRSGFDLRSPGGWRWDAVRFFVAEGRDSCSLTVAMTS